MKDYLEDAAEEYRRKTCNEACKNGFLDNHPSPSIKTAFIAGAKWQKEQMLNDAVEGEVMTNGFYPYEPRIVAPYPNCPYDFGDKVRVIVLPKED